MQFDRSVFLQRTILDFSSSANRSGGVLLNCTAPTLLDGVVFADSIVAFI
jgi:hypothetical protein